MNRLFIILLIMVCMYGARGQNVGIGVAVPTAKLDIAGNIKIADGTQANGRILTSDANGMATWSYPNNNLLQYNYIQPNGSGLESSATSYIRAGTFVYRGSLTDGPFSQFIALMYTTNTIGSYRVRLFDATNLNVIGTSTPSNIGSLALPEVVQVSSLANVPASMAVIEIQIITSSAIGKAGILSFQLYK